MFFRLGFTLITGLLLVLPAGAEDEPVDRAKVLAKVRKLLTESDSYAAIEFVQRLGPPPVVARAYADVVTDLYWKAKDPAAVVTMGRAGILFALVRARDLAARKSDESAKWRGHAKAIAYNVGSFTWPGWGEAGVSVAEPDLRAGLDAARLSLRLGTELNRPAGAMSSAQWLVGAHRVAAGDHAGAIRAFEAARGHAAEAKDAAALHMSSGYEGIARILAGEARGSEDLDRAVAALRKDGSDDARFYADQLGTALRALQAHRSASSSRQDGED